ncbi:MAG: competence protein [Flavobacteriaceae bacterium CG17_big_fil_post_rev_8_21_14_2_50_33_15]|nr:MAG: competence protein [Flavobacteriaceae bacterium CG17_big_fil_post_rev_8_21_14_2_50_33_15]
MKILNFSIIKLTLCLIIGILIGYFFDVPIMHLSYVLGFLTLIFTAIYIISRKQFIKTIEFGAITFIMMVCIGMLTVNFHDQKNHSTHYTNFISIEKDSIVKITFRIRDVLKPSFYDHKYIVDILNVDDTIVSGKSILNVKKDSLNKPFSVDEIFITKTDFKKVFPLLNPGQFNYKLYLEKQYIYHQLFLTNKEAFKVNTTQKTVFGIANKVREHLNLKLNPYSFNPDVLAIINAILLGQRQNLSEDVYSNYANAGAIHILAISGLHIGIILLFLKTFFKPIERLKHGLYIKTILIVLILWCFAIIAGLSASVTRAVTMFSIVAIGMHLKRPTNIYNTLAISMFVLLLFKPLFLFDVGFQLSYLAVFGIVSLDPYLYKLWIPKNKLIKTYWHTLTVTISAQLGIIPISIYYFHQFPGLFFVSNLLIIPVLGFILGLGILVIILAVLNALPAILVDTFTLLIDLMNATVAWISQQETFLFKNIPFSFLFVIASYIFIISLVRYCIKRSYKRLFWLLISIIIGQSALIYTRLQSPKNQFLIFHKSRNSLLGSVHGRNMSIAQPLDSITENENRIITDYFVKNHLKKLQKDSISQVYLIGNKTLLVIDSLGVYHAKTFKPNYILLRNSPKINLSRLIETLNPEMIIADGSNYKTYVERWKKTCLKTKIPFHQTSEKGAFIINY